MNDLVEARVLFDANELQSSLGKVSEILQNGEITPEAFLLRARIHYKMQKWGDAMNDYYSVLELEPDNQEAKSGIEMARNILGYFTPDMFNP